ncbi:hypothetical protein CLOP_g24598 [Closterium sp. NIES-67]|nr:hypothetical protein CLOP_g24598 [Closterium sp. NIES-67]
MAQADSESRGNRRFGSVGFIRHEGLEAPLLEKASREKATRTPSPGGISNALRASSAAARAKESAPREREPRRSIGGSIGGEQRHRHSIDAIRHSASRVARPASSPLLRRGVLLHRHPAAPMHGLPATSATARRDFGLSVP